MNEVTYKALTVGHRVTAPGGKTHWVGYSPFSSRTRPRTACGKSIFEDWEHTELQPTCSVCGGRRYR